MPTELRAQLRSFTDHTIDIFSSSGSSCCTATSIIIVILMIAVLGTNSRTVSPSQLSIYLQLWLWSFIIITVIFFITISLIIITKPYKSSFCWQQLTFSSKLMKYTVCICKWKNFCQQILFVQATHISLWLHWVFSPYFIFASWIHTRPVAKITQLNTKMKGNANSWPCIFKKSGYSLWEKEILNYEHIQTYVQSRFQ